GLGHLERDILRRAPHLAPAPREEDRLRLLTRTEATGTYTRLRSMSTVARAAAVTGGTNLVLAQQQRVAAAEEAERTGDPGVRPPRHVAARRPPRPVRGPGRDPPAHSAPARTGSSARAAGPPARHHRA